MPAPNTTELLLQQFRDIMTAQKKVEPEINSDGPPTDLLPPMPDSLIDGPLPKKLEDLGKKYKDYNLAQNLPTPSLPILPGKKTNIILG